MVRNVLRYNKCCSGEISTEDQQEPRLVDVAFAEPGRIIAPKATSLFRQEVCEPGWQANRFAEDLPWGFLKYLAEDPVGRIDQVVGVTKCAAALGKSQLPDVATIKKDLRRTINCLKH